MKTLKLEPGKTQEVYRNIGYCYINKKDYDNSIQYFMKCLNIDSLDVKSVLGLCLAYFEKNDIDSAKKYMNKAKDIEPSIKEGKVNISNMMFEEYNLGETYKKKVIKLVEELK